MRRLLLVASLFTGLYAYSQNTSPYWSLAGNSNATTASKLGTTNAINLAFFTNNVERARINTSGFVGIGTASPLSKLHVNGSTSFGASITSTNATRVMNLADPNAVMRILRVHSSFAPAVELLSRTSANGSNVAYWDLYTEPGDASFRIRDRLGGDNDRFAIKHTTGNVGVGTNNPAYKLHVIAASTAIRGETTNGYGVMGVGSSAGVYGSGTTYGVYGSGSSYGVVGSGSNYGVYGSGSTAGIYGSGTSYGVYGSSTNGAGVYGVSSYLEAVKGFSTNKQGGWFQSQNSQGLWAKTVAGDYAGVFEGKVYTYGTYVSSDAGLKADISDFSTAMDIINRLKPKTYAFRRDGKYASLNLPKGKHIGLIAQELEEVLPDLVMESSHDIYDKVPVPKALVPGEKIVEEDYGKETIRMKAVNYTELIPVLIRGIQELDSANKAKDEKIAILEEKLSDVLQHIGSSGFISSSAWMKQNTPNPVTVSTTIQFFIPNDTRAARILITNAKGQQLRVYNVSGSGTVNFAVGTLPSGTYTYSLVADGKTISTRKMVIAR